MQTVKQKPLVPSRLFWDFRNEDVAAVYTHHLAMVRRRIEKWIPVQAIPNEETYQRIVATLDQHRERMPMLFTFDKAQHDQAAKDGFRDTVPIHSGDQIKRMLKFLEDQIRMQQRSQSLAS